MYLLGDSYLKIGEKANAEMHFYFAHQIAAIKHKKKFQIQYAKLSYELGTRMKH
jgi:hypothetical protein